MSQPLVTISLRCFQRPARTIRAIQSVLDQNINGWELIVTGDACPFFETAEFRVFMSRAIIQAEKNGNKITCTNNLFHTGGCGYEIINHDIAIANGKYFIFLSNDDVILPNHLENYLSAINGTTYKWLYFDTWVEPYNAPRNAKPQQGMIGHSELIIETEYLRTMPPHGPEYGHDWELVKNLVKGTDLFDKAFSRPQTYIVKSVPGKEEQGID